MFWLFWQLVGVALGAAAIVAAIWIPVLPLLGIVALCDGISERLSTARRQRAADRAAAAR